MSLTTRVHVAAGINSVGNEVYWCRVFSYLGVEVPPVLSAALLQNDMVVDRRRIYQKLPSVKEARAQDNNKKIKAALELEAIDAMVGIAYDSEIGVAGGEEATVKK